MRFRPFRWVGAALIGAVLGVVLMPLLAFDRQPRIERTAEFTPDNIERAKRIIDSNNPRRLRNGAVRTVTVTAEDLDLAINYLANRYLDGSALATLSDGTLNVALSMPARRLPLAPYVNVELQISQGTPLPALDRVRVGRLPVPPSLAMAAVRRAAGLMLTPTDQDAMVQAIRQVAFEPSEARLTYQWHEELAQAVRGGFIDDAERDRLRAYQDALRTAVAAAAPGSLSLAALTQPLMALAEQRSAGGNPVTENRAAILVLMLYVNGASVRDIVPAASDWPRPRSRGVTLNGRGDSAQHFIVSAALAANTGGPFADAVGLYKEVSDSRGGSGFSFNDLAADRAGRRFGELAENRLKASELQSRAKASSNERILMPEAADLPESLSDRDFTARFGGVDGPGYTQLVAEIEKRISALPLYR